jgi:O-acetyl-ADP-ribose deacetylase (regulator of RNase III)
MKSWNRHVVRVGARSIEVVEGSIVDLGEHLDAIVSSDDNMLSHGGGISKVIWTAAGRSLNRFIDVARPALRLGDVFRSPAGELAANWVLHAVTIDFEQGRRTGPSEIGRLYRQVLLASEQADAGSVATPLLAAGSAGLSHDESLRGFLSAVNAWLCGPSTVHRVVLAGLGTPFSRIGGEVESALSGLEPMEWLVERAISAVPVESSGRLGRAWATLAESGAEQSAEAARALFEGSVRIAEWSCRTPPATRRGRKAKSLTGEGEPAPFEETLAVWMHRLREQGDPLPADVSGRLGAATVALSALAAGTETADDVDLLLVAARDALRLVRVDVEPARPVVQEERADSVEFSRELDLLSEAAAPSEHFSRLEKLPRASRIPELDAFLELRQPLSVASRSEPERARVVPVAPRRPATGTAHVRKLHRFLLQYLPATELEALYRRLVQQSYRGEPELQLLEYCVATDDPDTLITDAFTKMQLVAAIEQETGKRPDEGLDARRLALDLLHFLGFPGPVKLRGLTAVTRRAESAKPAMVVDGEGALPGAVAQVGADLEYVARVLLRFVASAAYAASPERLLRQWGVMAPSKSLDVCGLGDLFKFLTAISKHLETDTADGSVRLRMELRGRRLLPDDERLPVRLADRRNMFLHHRAAGAKQTLAGLRQEVRAFLNDALALYRHFDADEGFPFPRVVVVDHIVIDRWGRRKVHVRDDDGRVDVLFTDRDLEPGRVYFMHPLTNVLRIDPILVPAGDLASFDGSGKNEA